jgi:hypothetical protein
MSTSAQQELKCNGELLVVTDLNTSDQEKGRIVFVDKLNETRVISGMRLFGTPQTRLIVDAYNSANGVAFRTNVDQGTTTEGGAGKEYAFQIGSFNQVISGLPFTVSEDSTFQGGAEQGATLLTVSRYGTKSLGGFNDNQSRYLSFMGQNTFKAGEQVQLGIGDASNTHAVFGFQPKKSGNGAPLGGTSYLGYCLTKQVWLLFPVASLQLLI